MSSSTVRVCAALASAALLAGCSDAGDTSDTGARPAGASVTVGSDDDAASRVEALLYANALRSAGTQVTTRLGLGRDGAAVAAVERGEVTVAPALTTALWERYRPGVAVPSEAPGEDPSAQWGAGYVALSAVLPEGLGLGDPTSALDQEMLYVKPGVSGASLRGCAGVTGVVAVPAGSPTDLRGRYGCAPGPVTVVADEAAAAREVEQGRAALAQLGTLSPAAAGLVQVTDPDGVVPSRAVVPLVRRDGLTVPQTKRLSAVAGELTTTDLAAMIAKVESGERTAEQVAADWATEHPLT